LVPRLKGEPEVTAAAAAPSPAVSEVTVICAVPETPGVETVR
jgi:hypothetical protein